MTEGATPAHNAAVRLLWPAALSVPFYLLLLPAAGHGSDHPPPFLAVFSVLAALYLWAVRLVTRGTQGMLWPIVVAGVIFRCILLPAAPSLSGDPYRYVWDARVAAHGFNPYTAIPNSLPLRPLRDAVLYPAMGYHQVPTLYPPGAQALFGLAHRLAPDSVMAVKLLLALCDLGTAALLILLLRDYGRPTAPALVYLWNPLVILEFAHSGHVDATATLCVLATLLATRRKHPWLAGILLGLATLVKIYPILLLPALLGRRDPRVVPACVATVGLGYGLAWVVYGEQLFGYLDQYLGRDSINASLYALLSGLGGLVGLSTLAAHRLALLPLAVLLLWVARQRWRGYSDPATLLLLITTGYLLLSPSVLPWYVTAGVPLAALMAGRRWGLPAVWIVFSCVVPLEYTHHAYGEAFWPAVLLEYLVVYGLLAVAALGPVRLASIGARIWGMTGQLEGVRV